MKETHPPADPDFASHLAKESAERWERHFAQLAAFRERFGHCRVPSHWPEDAALGGWVRTQRAARRKGKLGPECLQRLEAVGFAWNVKSEPAPRPRSNRPPRPRIAGLWEIRFAQLAAFRERFGHDRIPGGWSELSGLRNWINTQRMARRKGQLKPERSRRLDEVGFAWSKMRKPATPRPPRASYAGLWEKRFAQLAAFRERFGHCRVPRAWREVPGLGNWTRTQRAVRRKGQLKPERIRRLEGIGFEWGRGPKDG